VYRESARRTFDSRFEDRGLLCVQDSKEEVGEMNLQVKRTMMGGMQSLMVCGTLTWIQSGGLRIKP